jgi:hypothetical protein
VWPNTPSVAAHARHPICVVRLISSLIAFTLSSHSKARTTWKEERLAEYLAVGSLPDLSDDDVRLITEAGSTVHHRFFVRHYTNP